MKYIQVKNCNINITNGSDIDILLINNELITIKQFNKLLSTIKNDIERHHKNVNEYYKQVCTKLKNNTITVEFNKNNSYYLFGIRQNLEQEHYPF